MSDKNIITKYLEQSNLYRELEFFGITLEPVMKGVQIAYKGFCNGELFYEKEFNLPSYIYYNFSNYDMSFEWVVTTVLRAFLQRYVSSEITVNQLTFQVQKDAAPTALTIHVEQTVRTANQIQADIELSIQLNNSEPSYINYDATVSYRGVCSESEEEVRIGDVVVVANVKRETKATDNFYRGLLVENYKFKHKKSTESMLAAIKGFIQHIESKEVTL